jgi:hypothetical protein
MLVNMSSIPFHEELKNLDVVWMKKLKRDQARYAEYRTPDTRADVREWKGFTDSALSRDLPTED